MDRLVEAACDVDALADLARDFMPMLEDAIGASGALLFEFGGDARPLGVSGSLARHLDTYNETLFGQDPLQCALRRLQPGHAPVVAIEDVMSYDELATSAAFHEFYRPLGVERLIGAMPTERPFGTPGMVGIVLGRPGTERPFGTRARRLLDRVLPALRGVVKRDRRARAAAREREYVMAAVRRHLTQATFVLDDAGRVRWRSPQADPLLADAAPRRDLVRPLAMAARAALRDHRATGQHTLAVLDAFAGSHAARVRTETLADGEVVVVVDVELSDPRGCHEDVRAVARAFGLTKAEASVLAYLAQGLGNRAIAGKLHVSETTVKTHVQQILGKLDIENRTQAALLAHGLLRHRS